MKKSLFLTVLLVLCFSLQVWAASSAQITRPCLVPWPQKVTMRDGSITPSAEICIQVMGTSQSEAAKVAETFADDLRAIGFAPSLAGKSKDSGPKIVLDLSPETSLDSEGYRLKTDHDIRITASTDTGLFWGTRTALQLLSKGPGQPVPNLSIDDKPLLPYRSVMIDVARQFHSIEFHRQFIKRLASYKINFYHIHFNDDQSYTLPSNAYPLLPTRGRHYSKADLRDLVEFAARYHVTIVPEVETLGHNTAITAVIPDAMCRGLGPRGLVCAGSDRSFEIIKTLISETMDIFPGPYFHIGADEVDFHAWDKCPDCEARKRSEGFKTSESLYNWFINRVNRFVVSKGRTTIAWDGFKLTMEPAVDKNVLIDEWDAEYAAPGDLLKAGYTLLNASSVPLYVVRNWAAPPEAIAEWYVWHFGPMSPPPPYTTPTMTPGKQLKGVCFCSWENTEKSQEAFLFGTGTPVEGYASPAPRVQLMAERAWTGSLTTAQDLLERVGVKK
jgi:hexosaminidase